MLIVNFAEASRLLFEQTKDPDLADHAIVILAELGRELHGRGEQLAFVHMLLARLLTIRFAKDRPPGPPPQVPESPQARDAVTSPLAWRHEQVRPVGKRRRLECALREFEQSGDASVLDEIAIRQAAADVLEGERRRARPRRPRMLQTAAGWLFWYRFLALPSDRTDGDFASAVGLLGPAQGTEPGLLPWALNAALADAHGLIASGIEVSTGALIHEVQHPSHSGVIGHVIMRLLEAARSASPSTKTILTGYTGVAYDMAYHATGDPRNLDLAIESLEAATAEPPGANHGRFLQALGDAVIHLVEDRRDDSALNRAIEIYRRAVAAPLSPEWPLAQTWEVLGRALDRRFQRTGYLDDNDDEIAAFRKSIDTADANERPARYVLLCGACYDRMRATNTLESHRAFVSMAEKYALSLPIGTAEHRELCGLIGRALTGHVSDEVASGANPGTEAMSDLNRGIEMLKMAANAPADESADASLVLALAEAERLRAELTLNLTDLNEAITSYARVLSTRDEARHGLALLHLGRLLRERFTYGRRVLQLNASIALLRGAADSVERGELAAQCLMDLSLSLTARFDATARRGDLDEAIDIARQSAGLPDASSAQGRLAELLIRRHHLTRSAADLDEAVHVAAAAFGNATPNHRYWDDLQETLSTARGLREEAATRHLSAGMPASPVTASAIRPIFESYLAQVHAGALDIKQAEDLIPAFGTDADTAEYVARLTADAHRFLRENAWPEALLRARLIVAGMRDALPDSAAAVARAKASLILVRCASEALAIGADPGLYESACQAGRWAQALGDARGDSEMAGEAALRLGALHMEMYTRYRVPGWSRRGRANNPEEGSHRSAGPDPTEDEPGDLYHPPQIPEPVTAMRTAADYLRQATGLLTGDWLGLASDLLALTLHWLRELDEPIDAQELQRAVETALLLLPEHLVVRRATLSLQLRQPLDLTEARRFASILENDLAGFTDREGAEGAVLLAGLTAKALTDTDPARAIALLDQLHPLPHEVNESYRAQVLVQRSELATRLHAPHWHPPTGPPGNEDAAAYLDRITDGNTCSAEGVTGMLIGTATWAVGQPADKDRPAPVVELGLQALGRLGQLADSHAETARMLEHMPESLQFLHARLLTKAAKITEGPDHALRLAEAMLEFWHSGADQHAIERLQDIVHEMDEINDDDAQYLLTLLRPIGRVLPLTDETAGKLFEAANARLLGLLLARGITDTTLGLLIQQGKGARLGEALLAGAPAIAAFDDPSRDMLAAIARLEAETEPESAADANPMLEELMTLAWPDELQRRPATSQADRLRNRQRAFDQHLSRLMLRTRPDPDTALHLDSIQRALGDRDVLTLYMHMYDEDKFPGIAQFIISADSCWATVRFFLDNSDVQLTYPDHTIMLTAASEAGRVAQLRTILQQDPGPASIAEEALPFLEGREGPVLLDQVSLDQLASLRAAGKNRLLISPYGPFHFFPFHLLGPLDKPWLEDWHVGYLPNVSLLLNPHKRPQRTTSLTSIGLDYTDPPHPKLPQLRGAISEATQCAAHFGNQPILNTEATKERVLAALHDSQYVHIAAHGTHNPDAPAFQAVHLAPAAEDDGRLFAYDLLNQDLSGIELVTLSACETGLGRIDRGDNLRGIPAALFLADVPVIIVTMWPVSDVTAAYFFPELYRSLASGQSIADAFRTAQQMTRAHFPQYRDWGAFALMGRAQ
jgi:tetratricopeptide (TPR) repeat protein